MNTLLEGFNQSAGFANAIVNDLLHQQGEASHYGSTIPENTAGVTKV